MTRLRPYVGDCVKLRGWGDTWFRVGYVRESGNSLDIGVVAVNGARALAGIDGHADVMAIRAQSAVDSVGELSIPVARKEEQDEILRLLADAWRKDHQQRLGQLILNVGRDWEGSVNEALVWNLADHEWAEKLGKK